MQIYKKLVIGTIISAIAFLLCVPTAPAEEIADGVDCESTTLNARHEAVLPWGNCVAHSSVHKLVVDLSKAKVKPIMAQVHSVTNDEAQNLLFELETVSQFFDRAGDFRNKKAVAAINGGFFPYKIPPVTMDVTLSRIIDSNYQQTWNPPLEGSFRKDQWCRMRERSELWIYGDSAQTVSIESVKTDIPSRMDLKVLGGGGQLLPMLASQSSRPDCPCDPDKPDDPVDKPKCDKGRQPDPNWTTPRQRTAVGYKMTEPEKLYILTVDKTSAVNGVTISELKDLMLQLGLTNAMALDGGGSTQMRIKAGPRINVNVGYRKVVSALAVYADPILSVRHLRTTAGRTVP